MSNEKIRLDLNNPVFQNDWFALSKDDADRVRLSLQKLSRMNWMDLYRSKGFHLEEIHSKTGSRGETLYSLRITQKFRTIVLREGEFLRFLTLHPDHDSAYE